MATAKENLEDFITCSVCLEKFEGRDPRFLPCGHAFCLTCIQDIHRTATDNKDKKLKDDEFRCPQCTTISNIPGKSVNNYPKYFQATHIHKMLQGKNPAICPSDNNEVTGFCFTCTKAFCDTCLKAHNKNRRYNNHVHVEVTTDSVQSLVCTVHDEMVEAFCTDCCKPVCNQCQLHSHAEHSISDFVIKLQHPVTPQRDICKNKEAVKDNIQRLETMQKDFNAHILDIKNEIIKHTQVMIAEITEQNKTLQAELARHQADTNRELENRKKRYRKSDEVITQARVHTAQLTQPIPELPLISLQNKDELISDIQQQIPQTPAGMKDVTRYQFTPQTADVLVGYLSEIKESSQNVKPSSSTFKGLFSKKGDAPPASLSHTQGLSGPLGGAARPRPKPSARSVPTQGTARPLSGAATLSEVRLITQIDNDKIIRGVSWTPAGALLVAAGWDNLLMYNTRGEKLPAPCDVSGVDDLVRTVAVHQQSSSVALVAGWIDRHLYITSLGGGRQAQRVCRVPCDCNMVTFTAGGDVLGCGGDKLLKYNTEGTKLWERQTKHQAEYITTTPDNRIIISGDNQLSVHDQDGRWLSFFPRDTDTLCHPTGVCVASSGHVFVADKEKGAVLMYTTDGTYMREVVTTNTSGIPEKGRRQTSLINNPTHLALYEDRYLAVVQQRGYSNSQLQVYDITP